MDALQNKKYVRRNHRKSRAGCQNCKRRRVKCDELKPECSNCIRFSITCDYSPISHTSPDNVASSSPSPQCINVEPVGPRRRGRPRKNWESINAAAKAPNGDLATTSNPTSKPSLITETLVATHENLNPEDLELLYHYVMVTASTLAGDTLGQHFYQTQALRIGFLHKHVLHFPLALSALHLARLQKSKREHYLWIGHRHYTAGIEALTAQIPYVNPTNCQGLYVASVLVCIYTFASEPKPGDFLIFNECGGLALWLPLLRGVRSIIQTAGPDVIFSGVLAPATHSDLGDPVGTPSRPRKARRMLDWKRPVGELLDFIKAQSTELGDAKASLFSRALEGMIPSFEACFAADGTDLLSPQTVESKTVMIWFYHMDPEFVSSLQAKEPLALVILSYFTVLMKSMEDRWFMQGWVDHILSGIKESVDKKYAGWLRWPSEQASIGDKVRMDIAYVTGAATS